MPLSFKFVAAAVCRSVVLAMIFIFDQSMICHEPVIALSTGSIVGPDVSPVGSSATRYDVP